ncbi:MAG: hypothetical protein ABIP53_11560 [Candidatus Limnocylindrales bacterium]
MQRLVLALIGAAALAALSACSSLPFLPTPGPTVAPCWVGELVEYRLNSETSEAAPPEHVAFAAEVINNRVAAYGLAEYRVETKSDSAIQVSLPRMLDSSDVRGLISATGLIEFVPVPVGEGINLGDERPPDQSALFGRQGIADARPGDNGAGQTTLLMTLRPVAAATLDSFAAAHFGEQFAIVVDGIVIAAPTIQARSFGGSISLSGGVPAEASRLLTLLRYPPIPGHLDEASLVAVSPRTDCA